MLDSPKCLKRWSGRRDSNPRRPAWEAGILPLNYSRLPCFSSIYLFSKDLGRSTASLFRLLRPSKTMGFDRKMDSKVDSKPVWEAFASALLVYCPLYCPSHDRFNISQVDVDPVNAEPDLAAESALTKRSGFSRMFMPSTFARPASYSSFLLRRSKITASKTIPKAMQMMRTVDVSIPISLRGVLNRDKP